MTEKVPINPQELFHCLRKLKQCGLLIASLSAEIEAMEDRIANHPDPDDGYWYPEPKTARRDKACV